MCKVMATEMSENATGLARSHVFYVGFLGGFGYVVITREV